jgi:hypothetical protein
VPMPTFVAAGAVASATTAAIAPAIPAGTLANDILICFVETGQQPVATPTGWALVGGAAVVQATGLVTDHTIFWKRAVGGDTAPSLATTPQPQNHILARIIGIRGCVTSGSPINGTPATGLDNVATATAFSIPGGTTTAVDCLVVVALSAGLDLSGTSFATGWTNVSLASLTERVDNGVISGNGGVIAAATGAMAVAGAYSATTGSLSNASTKAMMSFALQGASSTSTTPPRLFMARPR